MSTSDSRSLTNIAGVRSYYASQLDRETSAEKWDLVKVVVTQLFNKHTQYGLTFIKLTAAPEPKSSSDEPKKIGIFSLKKPLVMEDELGLGFEEEEDEDVRLGAMFEKSWKTKGTKGKFPQI